MEPLHIDPDRGLHAAADLTDEALKYLFELILWELAVRTDADQFMACLHNAIDQRQDCEDQIQQLRDQRDLMHFAAAVMLDIQRLPCTDSGDAGAATTGMYL